MLLLLLRRCHIWARAIFGEDIFVNVGGGQLVAVCSVIHNNRVVGLYKSYAGEFDIPFVIKIGLYHLVDGGAGKYQQYESTNQSLHGQKHICG